MNTPAQRTSIEAFLAGVLTRSEKLSYYASSRGWGFIMTWAHRVAGLIIVLYMFFHIVTLSGLYAPAKFASNMDFIHNFFFGFLEWVLAIPVIFHALNGARLILYEFFRVRDDAAMIRWVLVLSVLYVFSLGVFMLMGNQHVSVGFFWFTIFIVSLISAVVVYRKLWPTRNNGFWKLQRISGAFLLPMVSGHILFMHLNYQAGHDINTILVRVSSIGIKAIDSAFVILVFFHAGFGLNTIIGDFVENTRLKTVLTVVTTVVMTIFAYAGTKLIISVNP
ncbi:MAG: hypothetical protein BBJ60_05390 [Desulfobacterales bacterium S7086C20]|nr:MAG: hypothetical protein BBJ60_05390 [Desulfobacterales bacterium S7086C20]